MEWIKCEDRLPEKEKRVLVYSPGSDLWGLPEGVFIAFIEDIFGNGRAYWRVDTTGVSGYDYGVEKGDNATHWMPLPEEPPAGIPLLAENIKIEGNFKEALALEDCSYEILEARLILDPSTFELLGKEDEEPPK